MPQNIVIGADTHEAIGALIRAARPDLSVRGSRTADITQGDLEWGDTYVGFRRPPLDTMGNIRWVHCTGAGVDAWLMPGTLAPDVLLTRTSESFGPRIAEWALARALAFTQQLLPLYNAQQAGQWAPRETSALRGQNVLVLGTGDIGTHVARLFTALGASVTGVSRSGTGDTSAFAATAPVQSLASLVAEAQWIIVTLPLTNASRGLVSRDLLSRCRGAVLLNAGRGAVVDESALPDALTNGWLRGAALDVFEVEPLPATSPLWQHPHVIVSPHISGLTTSEGAAKGFLECLAAIERGERPAWVVDRERGY